MINEQTTKIALIGAGCSVVSERIAKEAKTWNLVMVSRERRGSRQKCHRFPILRTPKATAENTSAFAGYAYRGRKKKKVATGV